MDEIAHELHSIVIPVYNERYGIQVLYERMSAVADQMAPLRCEIILVNDGSSDGSAEELERICALDSRFKVLHFSRNFGHQIAITAGMEWSSGRTITVMDADLQDPPELIFEMLERWRHGYEVVYAVRRTRHGETAFKRWTAMAFYRLIRRLTNVDIPLDTGDFRLMDRRAVEAVLKMSEKHRFVRGMVSWVGFRQTGVLYDRAERQFGKTHFPFRKMFKFALDGITSFSALPLRLSTYLGLFASAASVLLGVWVILAHYFSNTLVTGWTSTMLTVLFFGGIQLLALGVIGEYLGRIYDEVKNRPLYIVARSSGFDAVAQRRLISSRA